jgi:hypothetical protein
MLEMEKSMESSFFSFRSLSYGVDNLMMLQDVTWKKNKTRSEICCLVFYDMKKKNKRKSPACLPL